MCNEIKNVEIKRADAEDIKLFYPDGSPKSCYAWVASYKGKAACLAGVILQKRGGFIVFSDMKETDAPKLTIWRTARLLMEYITALNLPMVVGCEIVNKRSQKLFRKLGFKHSRTSNGMEWFLCPRWQQ